VRELLVTEKVLFFGPPRIGPKLSDVDGKSSAHVVDDRVPLTVAEKERARYDPSAKSSKVAQSQAFSKPSKFFFFYPPNNLTKQPDLTAIAVQ
jgi:hypothetical protein